MKVALAWRALVRWSLVKMRTSLLLLFPLISLVIFTRCYQYHFDAITDVGGSLVLGYHRFMERV